MKHLFSPYQLKGLELKNRVVFPPMCQYSVEKKDGVATDWHFVHYVSRAVGGAGLIIIEMTDVEPDGRITDNDLGLWSDEHIEPLAKIVKACHKYGAKVAVQIAHAGRKAQHAPTPVAPSAIAFDETYKTPRALTTQEAEAMVVKYQDAVRRAVAAGFDAVELHGAHGYLIHQFQSPLTNKRTDIYGQNRSKFALDIIKASKAVMPEDMPLLMRITAKEYVVDGYGIEESTTFAREYKEAGVDMFHVSSGGEGPIGSMGKPGTHGGYQVSLATSIKEALDIPVIAVGRLDAPALANSVIGNEWADLVAVGRGMFRNPQWALEAAAELRKKVEVPFQYKATFDDITRL